jgi:hypothetical protein
MFGGMIPYSMVRGYHIMEEHTAFIFNVEGQDLIPYALNYWFVWSIEFQEHF